MSSTSSSLPHPSLHLRPSRLGAGQRTGTNGPDSAGGSIRLRRTITGDAALAWCQLCCTPPATLPRTITHVMQASALMHFSSRCGVDSLRATGFDLDLTSRLVKRLWR